MAPPFRTVAVVGSGALGIYYGVRLALAGTDVRFLLRADLPAVRTRGSLIVRIGSTTKELRPAQVYASSEEIGPVDLVLVTLKTTANGSLAAILPPLLKDATPVLTLQNGLGADEFLAERFGGKRVMGGLAFIANVRTAPGEVTCFHPGSLTLGEFVGSPGNRVRQVAAQFREAGVETHVADNLASARWHKLVWNVPFNGLTIAAGGVPTDRICGQPALAQEAKELMREVQAGAAALGHPISDTFLRKQYDVTPPMGPYRPSSLVDYLAGREVEIDPIWGEPLRRARAAGAGLPRIGLLYGVLRGLTTHT